MVKLFTNIMISSTLLQVLHYNFASSAETSCNLIESSGHKIANCSRKDVANVPVDLNKDIWSLDISYNTITNISETSFEPYQGLKQLIMVEMKNPTPKTEVLNPNAFRRLTKLEYLDMTKSQHTGSSDFYWPTSLKVLIIDFNHFESLNLATLSNLEELHAYNNSIGDFPRLNQLAPLKLINLDKNPIKTILVVEIAAFCRLQTFHFSTSGIQKEMYYCDCKRMEIWLQGFGIDSPLLNCTVPPATNEEVECEVRFYESEAMARRNCLAKISTPLYLKILFGLFLLIISVLVGLLVYLVLIPPEIPEETDEEGEHEGEYENEGDSE